MIHKRSDKRAPSGRQITTYGKPSPSPAPPPTYPLNWTVLSYLSTALVTRKAGLLYTEMSGPSIPQGCDK